MQPSISDLLNKYSRNGAISSRMSVMIKGGIGSSSQDLRLTFDKTERSSESKIGRKSSKTVVVVENVGGGASAVEERRRSVWKSRKSFAEKAGVSRGRVGRPSRL